EREVLVEVARGRSNGEIADHLVVSAATVKAHVGRILRKLGLRARAKWVVTRSRPAYSAPARPTANAGGRLVDAARVPGPPRGSAAAAGRWPTWCPGPPPQPSPVLPRGSRLGTCAGRRQPRRIPRTRPGAASRTRAHPTPPK